MKIKSKKKPKISKIKIINSFKKAYRNLIAVRTFEQYNIVLKQILSGKIKITSKSKYRQYKAVINKVKNIGIELPGKELPKWSKKGDATKRNIIDKYISPEKLEAILTHVPRGLKGRELAIAIQLSYYSGLRLSEVINLKRKDIIIDGIIKFNIQGKGDKYREVFLPRNRKDLLEGFQKFTITDSYVKNAIARIRDKTGINFSFHSFRHTFATNFLKERGGNIKLLQELLGHESLATTSLYLRVVGKAEEMAKLGF